MAIWIVCIKQKDGHVLTIDSQEHAHVLAALRIMQYELERWRECGVNPNEVEHSGSEYLHSADCPWMTSQELEDFIRSIA